MEISVVQRPAGARELPLAKAVVVITDLSSNRSTETQFTDAVEKRDLRPGKYSFVATFGGRKSDAVQVGLAAGDAQKIKLAVV